MGVPGWRGYLDVAISAWMGGGLGGCGRLRVPDAEVSTEENDLNTAAHQAVTAHTWYSHNNARSHNPPYYNSGHDSPCVYVCVGGWV